MVTAYPQFFILLRQLIALALALARARAGRSMAARIAMIAMTISSSIKVKAGPIPLARISLRLTMKSIFMKNWPADDVCQLRGSSLHLSNFHEISALSADKTPQNGLAIRFIRWYTLASVVNL